MSNSTRSPLRNIPVGLREGRVVKHIILASILGIASVQGVMAQTAQPSHGFVVVNGGYQLTANDFADGAIRRENAEDGRFDTTYAVKSGPTFDLAGGGILWRQLGIGVGVSRFSVSTPSSVTGTVPHPFFFNQARRVTGDVSGLTREELAIHIQARGVFPVGSHLQVMVFGGPSFFKVKQGVVTDFTVTEQYPFDSATFKSATTTSASASKMGFGGGGDVTFFFARQIGVGGTVQFAGTTVEVPAAGGVTQDVKVGGVKAGGGLRVRF